MSKVISVGVEGKKFSKRRRHDHDVLLILSFWLGAFEFKILKFLFFCCLNIFPMVAHYCHCKTKNLTAKTKYLTAKPKTSRQNQILHSKNKIALVLPWVFAFAVRYLVFAVKYLVLPWGLWFCREVFGFVVRYFVFAMRVLVLPWGFRFCREVFVFAVTVVGHRIFLRNFPRFPVHKSLKISKKYFANFFKGYINYFRTDQTSSQVY